MKNNFQKIKSECGVVLIIVLIAVAILTTLVVDLIYFTRVDTEISTNTRDDIKARYIAKSGVYVVAGAMKNKSLEELAQTIGGVSNQSENSQGFWAIRVPFFPVGDGVVSITVVDERSKINLNSLVSQTTNQVDRQVLAELKELFRMLGVESSKSALFIASLTNWLDHEIAGSQTQNDQDPAGADAEFYRGLENPYNIKDGPLDSVEEIRLIEGMDDEFFSKIKDYVTVYPADKKINFSTAPKVVMMAAIKAAPVSAVRGQESGSPEDVPDDVAESIAKAVIEERKNNPIIDRRKVSEIVKTIDPTLRISAGLAGIVVSSGRSDVFSITSTGSLGEENPTIRVTKAVIRKSSSQNSRGVRIISWKER